MEEASISTEFSSNIQSIISLWRSLSQDEQNIYLGEPTRKPRSRLLTLRRETEAHIEETVPIGDYNLEEIDEEFEEFFLDENWELHLNEGIILMQNAFPEEGVLQNEENQDILNVEIQEDEEENPQFEQLEEPVIHPEDEQEPYARHEEVEVVEEDEEAEEKEEKEVNKVEASQEELSKEISVEHDEEVKEDDEDEENDEDKEVEKDDYNEEIEVEDEEEEVEDEDEEEETETEAGEDEEDQREINQLNIRGRRGGTNARRREILRREEKKN